MHFSSFFFLARRLLRHSSASTPIGVVGALYVLVCSAATCILIGIHSLVGSIHTNICAQFEHAYPLYTVYYPAQERLSENHPVLNEYHTVPIAQALCLGQYRSSEWAVIRLSCASSDHLSHMVTSQVLIDGTLPHEEHELVLGCDSAAQLCVQVGDRITLLHGTTAKVSTLESLERTAFDVVGIVKTGIPDIDGTCAWASLAAYERLFDDRIYTMVAIYGSCADEQARAHEQELLSAHYQAPVYTWHDLYPAITESLALERTLMYGSLICICALVALVLLCMVYVLIYEKRRTLLILRTCGASIGQLTIVVCILAGVVTGLACLCGVGIASVCVWYLNAYECLRLPDAYYTAHVMLALDLSFISAVVLIGTGIAMICASIPCISMRRWTVADLIKDVS